MSDGEERRLVVSMGDAVEPQHDSSSEAASETEMDAEADTGASTELEPLPESSEEDGMSDEELSGVIEDICRSKAEEFRILGYEHVTGKDIWDCVNSKYQKTGMPTLHRIVNDILSLKVTSFMNWMTMSIYKDARLP